MELEKNTSKHALSIRYQPSSQMLVPASSSISAPSTSSIVANLTFILIYKMWRQVELKHIAHDHQNTKKKMVAKQCPRIAFGQGVEWEIHTENQHWNWKIWSRKSNFAWPSFIIRQSILKIEQKWHQTPWVFHIAYYRPCITNLKIEIERMPKNLTAIASCQSQSRRVG